jgi:hypothetical protein
MKEGGELPVEDSIVIRTHIADAAPAFVAYIPIILYSLVESRKTPKTVDWKRLF